MVAIRSWILAIVLLTSCAAPSPDGAAPSHAATTPDGAQSARPTATGPTRMISWQQAWGAVTPRLVQGAVGTNEVLALMAVSEDGEHVLGLVRERALEATRPGRVVLVETASGRMTVLRTLPTPQHGAGLADAGGSWFVWREASEQPNMGDWVLFAYSLEDKIVRRLAAAEPGPDGSFPQSSIWPRVDRDMVVWLQEIPGQQAPVRLGNVMSLRLPSGKPEVLAERKRGAALSWPYVAWAEPDTGEIIRHDLLTGTARPLHPVRGAQYVAIDGDSTVWVTDFRDVWLLEKADGTPRHVTTKLGQQEFVQFPEVTARFVTWQSNDYPAVFDRILGAIVTFGELGPPVGWSFLVTGSAIVWLGPPGAITPGFITPRDYFVARVR